MQTTMSELKTIAKQFDRAVLGLEKAVKDARSFKAQTRMPGFEMPEFEQRLGKKIETSEKGVRKVLLALSQISSTEQRALKEG